MYAEQDHTEKAITRFENATEQLKRKLEVNEGKPLTEEEKTQIKKQLDIQVMQLRMTGQLEEKLADFRERDQTLEGRERRKAWMSHDSKKLGRLMMMNGIPKPDNTFHAHHMIASTDKGAGMLRIMLFLADVKQDDPENGCWLVDYEKNHASWAYPHAVCHAWLNHVGYHLWLTDDVFKEFVDPPKKTDGQGVTTKLKELRRNLLSGDIPSKAIKKKGKKVGAL